MALSTLNKQNKTYLDFDELESLEHLLKGGYSIKDSLDILSLGSSHQSIQKIQNRLEKGERLATFISEYCDPKVRHYINSFLNYLSFVDALQVSLDIYKRQRQNKELIQKGLIYPIVLLIGTCFGTLLFVRFILPSMVNLMATFDAGNNLSIISLIMKMIAYSLLVGIVVVIALLIYYTRNKHIVKTYSFFLKHFPHSYLVMYGANQFTLYYVTFMKTSNSTKDGLDILSHLDSEPLVSYIASCLKESLKQGENIEHAIKHNPMDETLKKYFRIGMYSSNHLGRLEEYLYYVEKQTKKKLNIFTKVIQLCCYGMIGVIVIFVYQILFLPMEILQKF